MNVCLIDTAATSSDRLLPHWTPLGLAYVAAALEQRGHRVSILERDVLFRRHGLNLPRVDRLVRESLLRFKPDLVGISSPTLLFPDAARTARLVKRLFPGVPVVYGGHHASALPEDVLKHCPQLDIAVVGEGERTMVDLAESLPLAEIPGIFYRTGAEIRSTPPRAPIEDLDVIPMPARHLLDMDFHTRPTFSLIQNLTLRASTVFSSRGCPFGCAFCVESLPFGRRHRFHSTGRVLAEIETLMSRHRIQALYFLDEGFMSNQSRVVDLCRGLIRRGYNRRLKWAAQARVDSLAPDTLRLMREAGCIQLECGFETASDRLLKTVDKGLTTRRNPQIVHMIKAGGIRCHANIIVGLPGETRQEFARTMAFVRDSGFDSVTFSRFAPYPGSRLYAQLLAQGRIPEGAWATDAGCYEKANFTAMPAAVFDSRLDEARKRVVGPLNSRDRMKNTSLGQRLRSLSLTELRLTLLRSPLRIPRFLLIWLAARLRRGRSALS